MFRGTPARQLRSMHELRSTRASLLVGGPEGTWAERFIVTQAGGCRGPPRIDGGHKTPSSPLNAGLSPNRRPTCCARFATDSLREPVRSRMGGNFTPLDRPGPFAPLDPED